MTFISGESNSDHGPNSVPQSAYNLLHSEYIIEKINHIEALAMIGDEESLEDACEIGNELFPEWELQVFDISGLAYKRDGFMQRPNDLDMEFFSCKVTYKNIDIIDDKVHLVFHLEDDIVIDSNTNEEAPLTEIVFPWQNIFRLDQTE